MSNGLKRNPEHTSRTHNFEFGINDLSKKLELLAKRDTGVSVTDGNGEPIRIGKSNLMVTKLDLSDLSGMNDSELCETIKFHTGINIESPEGLTLLNKRFESTMQVYIQTRGKKVFESRYGENIFEEIQKRLPFKNASQVLDFMRLPSNSANRGLGKVACFLIKMCYSVNDILSTPGTQNLQEQERRLFGVLSEVLGISEEDSMGGSYKGSYGGLNFTMFGRPKSLRSTAEKIMGNPDYMAAEKIRDGIGYTIEFGGKDKDVLEVMGQIYQLIGALGGTVNSYDNKGVDLASIFSGNIDKFNPDFIAFLRNKKVENNGKKDTSSSSYKEIKIQGVINGVHFEIKFTNQGNHNQDGINFSGVYEYLEKHIQGSIIRQGGLGYITEDEIKILVDDFFENLKDLLAKNPEKRETAPSDYLVELWNDLAGKNFIRSDINYPKLTGSKNSIIKQKEKLYRILGLGLTDYYKSKLIPIKVTPNGAIGYTTQRMFELSRNMIIAPSMDRRVRPRENKPLERRHH